jgi:hypothetical protein
VLVALATLLAALGAAPRADATPRPDSPDTRTGGRIANERVLAAGASFAGTKPVPAQHRKNHQSTKTHRKPKSKPADATPSDATPSDATPTGATPTGATPTDAPSAQRADAVDDGGHERSQVVEAEDAGPAASARSEKTWLEARLLAGVTLRRFSYADEVRGALRGYELKRAGWLSLGVRVYPAAELTSGILADLAVFAWYEPMFGVTSHVGSVALPTNSVSYGFGARLRHGLGSWELTGGLAYGRHRYDVADTFVPDPDYQFARLDAEVTWRPGSFIVVVGLGYRQLFGTGELGEDAWFPHLGEAGAFARGFGVDAGLQAGYRLLDRFELLVGGRFLEYRLPLAPAPADSNPNGVAGTAHDIYVFVFGGLGVRL